VNSPAEKLLQRFGIREPGEIDLEAIAYELGVLVVFDELDGCDARIVAHARTPSLLSTRNQAESVSASPPDTNWALEGRMARKGVLVREG